MKKIFLVLSVALISSTGFSDFVCSNKRDISNGPFYLHLTKTSAELSAKDASCSMEKVDYNPNSPKYQGWIRVASDKKSCPAFGKVLFGESALLHKGLEIYWLSVSEEVQAGKEGFAQLGIENDADPGAGAVGKVFVRCFPKN